MEKGSEFIVKLSGIKLPAAAEDEVSREINAAVMRALGRIDLKGDLSARIPWKEWRGIWIEKLRGPLPVLGVTEIQH
jgi:hypothetical protein